jgi:hypothetical protein
MDGGCMSESVTLHSFSNKVVTYNNTVVTCNKSHHACVATVTQKLVIAITVMHHLANSSASFNHYNAMTTTA